MSAAESDDLQECENCGRLNNTRINPDHCYACGQAWGEADV